MKIARALLLIGIVTQTIEASLISPESLIDHEDMPLAEMEDEAPNKIMVPIKRSPKLRNSPDVINYLTAGFLDDDAKGSYDDDSNKEPQHNIGTEIKKGLKTFKDILRALEPLLQELYPSLVGIVKSVEEMIKDEV